MRVAHIGPPLARRGGPAGYLWQLAAVAERRRGGAPHEVSFPEPAKPTPPAPPSIASRVRASLGRVKRTIAGPPKLARPDAREMRREGGVAGQTFRRSMQSSLKESAASVQAALTADADVLFAHDPATAEHVLAQRRPGQQVWLMLHSPMPLALYLTWNWGVPEWTWTDVASLPDVRRWTGWELDVCKSADRVVIPCEEALGELARADARFAALSPVDYVLTGAMAPRRSAAARSRTELREGFGLPVDAPVGLFLGTAQPYRGLDLLLDAARALPASVPGRIAVAGPPKETLPAHPRIHALGPVGGVGDLLAAVDFAVNVNRFSLFDLSVIEAAEAGRPLLLHEIGGNRRFAELGAGCVMLPDLSSASIIAGLAALCSMPEERRAELGRRSRICYERHLTPDHMWDDHMRLYTGAAVSAAASS